MDEKFTLDRVVRLLLGALVVLGLFYLLKTLSDVLLPFFIALLIAYLMNPFVSWIERLVKKRAIAIFLSMLVFAGVLVGLWFLIVPALMDEFKIMQEWLVQLSSTINRNSISYQEFEHWILQYVGVDQIKDMLSYESLGSIGEKVLPGIWSSLGSVFGFLFGLISIVFLLLYLVFILMDYKNIESSWKDYIPPKWKGIVLDLAKDLEEGMRAYFMQQTKIVLTVGVLFAVCFKIVGLPLAISLGLFVGLLNYIPYMQFFGLLPCTLAAALLSVKTGTNFWMIMLWIVLIFSIIQLFQESVLVPKLMGNITGFSPAIILLSLSIWGALLGITGIIVALPITTIIVSYYKRFVINKESLNQ